MPMLVRLKAKYRLAGTAKTNIYKNVTGPHCCCNHKLGHCCASGRKKGRKGAQKRAPTAA